jgi:hypothetical protein
MGRPLKIRKQNDNGTHIDEGFPNDGTTSNGYDGDNPGVVGGTQGGTSTYSKQIAANGRILVKAVGTITTDTTDQVIGTDTVFDVYSLSSGNSEVYVDDGAGGYTLVGVVDSVDDAETITLQDPANVEVTDAAFYVATVNNSGLLRQKGAKKFLIVSYISIQDEGIAPGQAYMISDLQDTDWAALGAPQNATEGVVFTATASGSGLTTDGVVYPVGVCTLTDSSDPAGPNQVSVAVYNDGDTTYATKITNHWVRDFDNTVTPEDGTNTKFVATFFNDGGNVDTATGYTLVGINNWC